MASLNCCGRKLEKPARGPELSVSVVPSSRRHLEGQGSYRRSGPDLPAKRRFTLFEPSIDSVRFNPSAHGPRGTNEQRSPAHGTL